MTGSHVERLARKTTGQFGPITRAYSSLRHDVPRRTFTACNSINYWFPCSQGDRDWYYKLPKRGISQLIQGWVWAARSRIPNQLQVKFEKMCQSLHFDLVLPTLIISLSNADIQHSSLYHRAALCYRMLHAVWSTDLAWKVRPFTAPVFLFKLIVEH